MGAGPWRSLWRVTVPQCLPGVAAGAFFAFNISFDEAVVSLFLRSPEVVTLPIQIYTQLEFSPDPSIAAVSSLMIGLTIVLIVLIERAVGLQNEPPRVYWRVCGSIVRQLFRQYSSLRRKLPLLRLA